MRAAFVFQDNMLLSFFLLFFLCESTVKSWSTIEPTSQTPIDITDGTTAAEEMPSPLQLVATPDYPVAAGQRVDLHCSAFIMTDSVIWSWQRLENQTWKEVANGRDLALTEPQQSGLYRCRAEIRLSANRVSRNHTVYIIAMRATVGENLGVAAFILSILALIINLAIVCWLVLQRFGHTLTTSDTKDIPKPEKSPKGCLPKNDSDGDVYMNYTNEAYADLDPTNMTADNVYSSLS